jgi:hypothetical protein
VNGLCGEEGMGKEKQNMGMGYAGGRGLYVGMRM